MCHMRNRFFCNLKANLTHYHRKNTFFSLETNQSNQMVARKMGLPIKING